MRFAVLMIAMMFLLIGSTIVASEKIVYSSNESGNHDIWMINPDGTGKAQITNNPIDEFSPRIAHDGKTIAFTRFDGGQYHGNIYFYDVATGAISQVTSANDVAYDLSWSPDDTKIAYSRTCGGRQIAVLDLETSAVDVLTGCSGGSYGAIWHPTDGRIYYWDYIPGGCNWGMYSVPAAGGAVERADSRTYWDTEWSFNSTNPDNIAAAVYFGTGCLHGSYLALLNRADSNYTLIHGGGDIADRNPAWSPDGTRIAFATQEWTVTTARNMCIYDVQSGNLDTLPIGASSGSQYGSIADLSWGTIVSGELVIPSISILPCSNENASQPIDVVISHPIVALNIPLKIPAGVTIDSVSCDGLVTEGWDELVPTIIDEGAHLLRLVLATSPLGSLQPGTHTVANIYFASTPLCREPLFIHWDTALSGDSERRLAFSDASFQTILPEYDRLGDSSEILGYEPGDLNGSLSVNLSDLSLLIAYLVQTPKPSLCQPLAANCNGEGSIDISDLAILIAYLTTSPGPILECAPEDAPAPKLEPRFMLSYQQDRENGLVSINSIEAMRGILLKVRTSGEVVSHLSREIDIITERSGEELTILAIDMQGKATIASGLTDLFSFDAPFEVLEAEASTLDFTTIYASLGAPSATLPTEFGLSQNYPNPFNPSTEIGYSLPTAAHVTLEVYNLTGQRVATLVDADQATGTHTVRWDASPYASGVYMYRLTAGQFTETKKMLLIK